MHICLLFISVTSRVKGLLLFVRSSIQLIRSCSSFRRFARAAFCISLYCMVGLRKLSPAAPRPCRLKKNRSYMAITAAIPQFVVSFFFCDSSTGPRQTFVTKSLVVEGKGKETSLWSKQVGSCCDIKAAKCCAKLYAACLLGSAAILSGALESRISMKISLPTSRLKTTTVQWLSNITGITRVAQRGVVDGTQVFCFNKCTVLRNHGLCDSLKFIAMTSSGSFSLELKIFLPAVALNCCAKCDGTIVKFCGEGS